MNPSAGGSGLVLHQIRRYSRRRMLRGHRPSMRCPKLCGDGRGGKLFGKALHWWLPKGHSQGTTGRNSSVHSKDFKGVAGRETGWTCFPPVSLSLGLPECREEVRRKRGCVGQQGVHLLPRSPPGRLCWQHTAFPT